MCSFLAYNVLVRHVRPLRGIRRVSAPGTIVLLDWYRSRPRGLGFEYRFCIGPAGHPAHVPGKTLAAGLCLLLSVPPSPPPGQAGRPARRGAAVVRGRRDSKACPSLEGLLSPSVGTDSAAHTSSGHTGGCRVPPSPRGPSGPTLLGKGALCRQPGASQHLPGKAASEPFHEENTGYYSPAALRKDLGAPVSRTERHPETPL